MCIELEDYYAVLCNKYGQQSFTRVHAIHAMRCYNPTARLQHLIDVFNELNEVGLIYAIHTDMLYPDFCLDTERNCSTCVYKYQCLTEG